MPCKHLAATFYLLAEAFDADPFLILRWRGRDRETLLRRLRELRADGPARRTGRADRSLCRRGRRGARAGRSASARSSAGSLLAAPPPLPARPTSLDVEPDLLLRQLPTPGAVLGGEALAAKLRTAYQHFGAAE